MCVLFFLFLQLKVCCVQSCIMHRVWNYYPLLLSLIRDILCPTLKPRSSLTDILSCISPLLPFGLWADALMHKVYIAKLGKDQWGNYLWRLFCFFFVSPGENHVWFPWLLDHLFTLTITDVEQWIGMFNLENETFLNINIFLIFWDFVMREIKKVFLMLFDVSVRL